jgi:DNA helicase-2/ATP-dependent DNA helicase PcrA
MEEAVIALLKDGELQARLAARVKHVIVDEYQDLNPIQECIVRKLHELGADICVVGDDDQTIYQWRGSDVRIILDFAKNYTQVKQVRLEENFRSSQGIVETARDFIRQNNDRSPKAMIPTDAQPSEVGDIVALHFDSPEEEAGFIAARVKELRGIAFKDGDKERGLSYLA